VFAQGEYVGPHRLPHVPEYRLRVDDQVNFIYRLTAEATARPYEFNVGDRLRVESLTQPEINQDILVQPDGMITMKRLGQVRAAGRTIDALRADLEQLYKELIRVPALTITPLEMNSRLTELRNAVDSRFGAGGQTIATRVTPEGTVQLPALGSVPVQGLTLEELREEVNQRYLKLITGGLDITPVLAARAPRFVYVLGEVRNPGRIEMSGPTTVIQALAMAGSWTPGSKLKHVVILRRDEHWELMATKLDIRPALRGLDPCPSDEVWMRDSDIVIVPKTTLQIGDELIDQIFTRGIYAVFPVNFNYQLRGLTVASGGP